MTPTAVLAWLGIALLGIALVALFFAVLESLRVFSSRRLAIVHRRSGLAAFGLVVLVIVLVLGSLLSAKAAGLSARSHILGLLNAPHPTCSLELNGSPAIDSASLLASLRQIRDVDPHHSRLAQRIQLTVRSGDRASQLELARDSQVPTEYRVLWSGAFLPIDVELGSISTTVLDEHVAPGHAPAAGPAPSG